MGITKKGIIAALLGTVLILPFAAPSAFAQSTGATGTVDISATCGLVLSTATFGFGTLANLGQSGDDQVQVDFTNSGSVNSQVNVTGSDWESGSSTFHINSEQTKFSRTTQGTSGAGVPYADKNPLNGTVTPFGVEFGNVIVSPSVNQTYWQLNATLINLPFSGALTQTITFTFGCITP